MAKTKRKATELPASHRTRDNFPSRVLRLLAGEAGHCCSNPDCRAPTSGPSRQKGLSNVGVGAHITAAAAGGERFDKLLTPTQRKSPSNGVWLCAKCGRLIDNDAETYPVQLLKKWKNDAIERARRELASGGGEPIRAGEDRVLEAPGLNEIRKVSWEFLRPRGWDFIRDGLRNLGAYATEGTNRQKRAVLDALSRLATYVRASMPEDVLSELMSHLQEAMPYDYTDNPNAREALQTAIEVAGHVGYDATLYCRDGLTVIECARVLSDCAAIAGKKNDESTRQRALKELADCEAASARANPSFDDAGTWFRYHRENPGQGYRVPDHLHEVEARLLGVR